MKNFNIKHEDRIKLLEAYNELCSVLTNIQECNDLWLSDVGKLQSLDYKLRSILQFDTESGSHYYANYKLKEDCKNKKGA